MMKRVMVSQKKQFGFTAIALCCLFLVTGFVRFSEQTPGEKPDLSQPRQSSCHSEPMERLNSGFINILSGPIEPFNHLREEIKQTNPVRGFLPGVIQGTTWLVVREAVGVFEMLTFFAPWKPHLEPINVDWLSA